MSIAVKICGLKDREALHAAVEGGASYLGFVFVPSSKRYVTPDQAQELLATLPQPTLCRFVKATSNDIHSPVIPDECRAVLDTKIRNPICLSKQNKENGIPGSRKCAPRNDNKEEHESLADSGMLILTALFLDPSNEEVSQVCAALAPFLGLIQLHGNETPKRVLEIQEMTGLPVMKAIHIATADDFETVKQYEKVADMFLFDTKVGKSPTGGTGKSFDWKLLAGRTFTKPWMLAGGLTAKNIKKAIKQSGASIVDVSSGVETDGKKDVAKIKELLRVCAAYD